MLKAKAEQCTCLVRWQCQKKDDVENHSDGHVDPVSSAFAFGRHLQVVECLVDVLSLAFLECLQFGDSSFDFGKPLPNDLKLRRCECGIRCSCIDARTSSYGCP